MTAVLAALLVLTVVAYVVLPLLQVPAEQVGERLPGENERWAREKAVAVLAISEADFDRATGKLSDDDYQVLRTDYEGRALHAMDRMDQTERSAPAVTVAANFCASCGSAFRSSDAFCGGCGRPRAAA